MNTATLFKRSERSEVMINFNFKFKNKIFRLAWAPVYDHGKATKRPRNIKRCISLVNKIRRKRVPFMSLDLQTFAASTCKKPSPAQFFSTGTHG